MYKYITGTTQTKYLAVPNRVFIFAASTRKNAKQLVRTDSSNIWAYAIDVKEYGDETGTVYIQFKGKTGGPGELYCYYDVPVDIYRKLVTAPSKGHFFWKNIRGKYYYSKLTGDKKTKMPMGI